MYLLLLCLVAALPETPDSVHAAALADLLTVDPAARQETRYLSLHAYPEEARDGLARSVTFALNSTSWRQTMTAPVRVGPLLRIDLAAYGWDTASRTGRIARLTAAGVKTAGFKADFWKEVAARDPYFFVTAARADGVISRGWLDPEADLALRTLTRASKAVIRADWLAAQLLLDDVARNAGGLYSQALLLPADEKELYAAFGVDLKLVDSDPQLKSGGAVLESIVALHNRELQLTPSLYGFGERYIWRSFDVASDEAGDRSVIEALAGTVRRDGGEYIGTLPNGLHWYWVGNAQGKQLAVVPQAVAIDKRPGGGIKDRSVINAYKCISCHGPASGVYPFEDAVGPAVLAPEIALLAVGKNKADAQGARQAVEDYYLSGLRDKVVRQQDAYAARVKACNGTDPGPNADAVVSVVEDYLYGLVSSADAAREMGRDPLAARVLWRNSGNPQLAVLSSGRPIRRGAWESAWADAMRADGYAWEEKSR